MEDIMNKKSGEILRELQKLSKDNLSDDEFEEQAQKKASEMIEAMFDEIIENMSSESLDKYTPKYQKNVKQKRKEAKENKEREEKANRAMSISDLLEEAKERQDTLMGNVTDQFELVKNSGISEQQKLWVMSFRT